MSQAFQKRLLKFLLKRAIGPFLLHDLDLDHMDLQWRQGQLTLDSLELRAEALNAMLPQPSIIHVMQGHVRKVSVSVPWLNFLSGRCELEIEGIDLGVQLVDGSADVDDQHLEETIRNSIIFRSDLLKSSVYTQDPVAMVNEFVAEEHPGELGDGSSANTDDAVSILTSLVDKILSRLLITIKEINVTLKYSGDHGFEISIPRVVIKDETEGDCTVKSESIDIFSRNDNMKSRRKFGSLSFSDNAPCLKLKVNSSENNATTGSIEVLVETCTLYVDPELIYALQVFMRSLGEAVELLSDFSEAHHELETSQSIYYDASSGNSLGLSLECSLRIASLQVYFISIFVNDEVAWQDENLSRNDYLLLEADEITATSSDEIIEIAVDRIAFGNYFTQKYTPIVMARDDLTKWKVILKTSSFGHRIDIQTGPILLNFDIGFAHRLLDFLSKVEHLDSNERKLPFSFGIYATSISVDAAMGDTTLISHLYDLEFRFSSRLRTDEAKILFDRCTMTIDSPDCPIKEFLKLSTCSITINEKNAKDSGDIEYSLADQKIECWNDVLICRSLLNYAAKTNIEIQISMANLFLAKPHSDAIQGFAFGFQKEFQKHLTGTRSINNTRSILVSIEQGVLFIAGKYQVDFRRFSFIGNLRDNWIVSLVNCDVMETLDSGNRNLLTSLNYHGQEDTFKICLHQMSEATLHETTGFLSNMSIAYGQNLEEMDWIREIYDTITIVGPGPSIKVPRVAAIDIRSCSVRDANVIALADGQLVTDETETLLGLNSMKLAFSNSCKCPAESNVIPIGTATDYYKNEGYVFCGDVQTLKLKFAPNKSAPSQIKVMHAEFDFDSELYFRFASHLKSFVSTTGSNSMNAATSESSVEFDYAEGFYTNSPTSFANETVHTYEPSFPSEGNPLRCRSSYSDDDDQYSFIDDYEDSKILPIADEFIVKTLTNVGLKIIDDFFVPKRGQRSVDTSIEVEISEIVIRLRGKLPVGDPLLSAPFIQLNSLDQNNENNDFVTMKEEIRDYIEIEWSSTESDSSTLLPEDSVSMANASITAKSSKISSNESSGSDCIELQINGLTLNYCRFKELGDARFELILKIQNCEIVDYVASSFWHKMMTRRKREHIADRFRDGNSNIDMIKLVTESFMKDGQPEMELKINVSPLRFHIDQDTLMFIVNFFAIETDETRANDDTFFRSFELNSISTRVDYKPKHFNVEHITSGQFAEMMNLIHLNGVNIELPHIAVTGVSGVSNLLKLVQLRYLQEISGSQLPRILAGISPVRPFVNIGAGIKDLIMIPMQQAKQQGHLWRGVKKGASTFAKKALRQSAELSINLTVGAQNLFEKVDTAVSPTSPWSASNRQSKFSDVPQNLEEGLGTAYQTLCKYLEETKSIIAVPMQSTSATKTGKVIRAMPIAIIHPLVGISSALRYALLGAKASIDPQSYLHAKEKYKSS